MAPGIPAGKSFPMPNGESLRNGPLYRRAVSYIERLLNELQDAIGLTQKEAALSIGLAESVFSSKLRGIRSHFYEDEFELVATFLRRKTGRPLIGFPHIDWYLMEVIDRQVGGWNP